MKRSYTQAPRTMAECEFLAGYKSLHLHKDPEPLWQVVAGYALAVAIGAGLATCLFYGLSS